jgi:murein DD-endopeptidase MepM/ murein hydrolase activator NlpD
MNRLMLLACIVCLPLKQIQLTSGFGYRLHPVTGQYKFHSGIDLRAHRDTVFAVLDGVVSSVAYNSILGVYIKLEHGEFQSSYGHLSEVFVLPGNTVRAGHFLAITGATGRVTGEHLHFGIQFQHQNINPLEFLFRLNQLNDYGQKH